FPQAAQLRSRRISRIAVHAGYRRNALGHQLLQRAAEAAKTAVWTICRQLRLYSGTGCILDILRLSLCPHGHTSGSRQRMLHRYAVAAADVCRTDTGKCRRTAVCPRLRGFSQIWGFSPVQPVQAESLNEREWRMLAGFAYAAKPQAVAEPALVLLQRAYPAQTGELSQLLSGQPEILKARHISGKKALLNAQRQETAVILQTLRPEWAQQTAAEIRAF
ncbi:P-loop ATPase, partial [Morganella morganii]